MNSEKNNNITITYNLKSCKIISFAAFENEQINSDNILNNFTFEITNKQSIIPDNKSVEIFTDIKVYTDQTKKILLGGISTLNVFEIYNFKEIVTQNDKEIQIPLIIMATFVGLSISNTRGMLIAKAAGTCLQNAIIPIINPTEHLQRAAKEKHTVGDANLVSDSPK